MNFKKLLMLAMSMRLFIFLGVFLLIGAHYMLSTIWFNPTVTLDEVEARLKEDSSDIDATNDEGFTGLVKAIAFNDYDKAELLLKYGAAINRPIASVNLRSMNYDPQQAGHFDAATPLHFAIMYGNYLWKTDKDNYSYDPTDMVQLLLNYGADVNARDKNNDTPMHKLFFMDQPGTSEDRRFQILELLLAYGADINAQNNQGFTMAHIAAERNYGQWLQRMINVYGDIMDLSLKDNAGLTARNLADKNGYGFLVEILDTLIKPLPGEGGNAQERDVFGKTGLMHAVARNNYEGAVEQLKLGADVNAVDALGNSALHYAVNNKKRPLAFVQLLIGKNAQVDSANKDGLTPLVLSTTVLPRTERALVASLLLEHGASLAAQDKKMNTPLHRAILNNDVQLVKILKKGFDLQLKNSNGLTARDLAIKKNNRLMLDVMG